MPVIRDPQVESIVHQFEALVRSCELYRAALESRRTLTVTTGPAAQGGAFRASALLGPKPKAATPEWREYGLNVQLIDNIFWLDRLLELLDGEVFDRVRPIVDGLGTLEAAARGEWV